jgi:aspartate ammonia-lyase
MKGKYLITTDDHFIAPDGNYYKAVWGDVQVEKDTFLGVETNRNSTNWFLKIGSDEKHVIVAGCQVHYACRCDEVSTECINVHEYDAINHQVIKVPSMIYIAE